MKRKVPICQRAGLSIISPNKSAETTAGIVPTMYRGRTNDHKDILSVLEGQAEVLGIVKESVAASKGDVDGIPAVISDPKSDVAVAYFEIAKKI